jgi:hypothetical protein
LQIDRRSSQTSSSGTESTMMIGVGCGKSIGMVLVALADDIAVTIPKRKYKGG